MCLSIRSVVLVVICTVVCLPVAQAADPANGPWSGKLAFGYLATSGNTDYSNLKSGIKIGYQSGQWQHFLEAFAIHATEDQATTAEAYELGWKSERNLSEQDFLFGRVNWRKDRFSGYDTQLSESVGYGRRLIDRKAHKLNAEIGFGARQSELSDGNKEDERIARGGLSYRWLFSESAEFNQNLVVESGPENIYRESISSLKSKLVGKLALVASFTVKNNSEVPVGVKKTDTYSALSIEYSF